MTCCFKYVGMQMDVRDIENSSKFYIPPCGPAQCGKIFYKWSCWCCMRNPKLCTKYQKDCDSDPRCPRISLEN
ncbi:unnamed protein product [Arabidopsis halleri]